MKTFYAYALYNDGKMYFVDEVRALNKDHAAEKIAMEALRQVHRSDFCEIVVTSLKLSSLDSVSYSAK